MISVASVAPRRRFLRLPPLPRGKYRRRHPFAFLRPFAVYPVVRCSFLVEAQRFVEACRRVFVVNTVVVVIASLWPL